MRQGHGWKQGTETHLCFRKESRWGNNPGPALSSWICFIGSASAVTAFTNCISAGNLYHACRSTSGPNRSPRNRLRGIQQNVWPIPLPPARGAHVAEAATPLAALLHILQLGARGSQQVSPDRSNHIELVDPPFCPNTLFQQRKLTGGSCLEWLPVHFHHCWKEGNIPRKPPCSEESPLGGAPFVVPAFRFAILQIVPKPGRDPQEKTFIMVSR